MLRERGQTEPGLLVFYDIQPGNAAGVFISTQEPARGISDTDNIFTSTKAIWYSCWTFIPLYEAITTSVKAIFSLCLRVCLFVH